MKLFQTGAVFIAVLDVILLVLLAIYALSICMAKESSIVVPVYSVFQEAVQVTKTDTAGTVVEESVRDIDDLMMLMVVVVDDDEEEEDDE